MNPPSALFGAMNKERKPFTYTPGGLDLSEIKSERMAARLMRNAMSQGVPETPAQTVHSPPAPVNPNAIPNFNCLPVQVFPTFQLPANPKSLLRTRSNPNPIKEPPLHFKTQSNISVGDNKPDTSSIINSINANNNNITNNNRPASMYDYTQCNSSPLYKPTSYGSYGHTEMLLPEKFYDAEVCSPELYGGVKVIQNNREVFKDKPASDVLNTNTLAKTDFDINSIPVTLTSPLQDTNTTNDYEQKEVKISTKQSETENKTDQNGDTEAAVVIKLPAKSSSAKTETKVEISKKILPDGTIEEVKTTTTKTTIDGKTEITTETETRTIPKETLEVDEEEEDVEEEEEEEEENGKESKDDFENEINKTNGSEEAVEEVVSKNNKTDTKQNGHIITGDEKVETSTTKKVVVVQSTQDESDEEIEEEEVEEEAEEDEGGDVEVEEIVILRKSENKLSEETNKNNIKNCDDEEKEIKLTKDDQSDERGEEEDEDDKGENNSVKSESKQEIENNDVEEDEKKEEELEENVEEEPEETINEDLEEEYEEAEDTEIKKKVSEQAPDKLEKEIVDQDAINNRDKSTQEENDNQDKPQVHTEASVERPEAKEENDNPRQEVKEEIVHEIKVQSEPKVSFREPSIPLEKVEDIEIKPIVPAQEIIKKSHTEIITTTTDKPTGALSTQTEYKQIENIVTVNRTTKTLDHAYEQTQQSLPTLKTYFSPSDDRNLSTPQPVSRPYQPVYPPEPQVERRHSLLLDRLSVDRQVNASDTYQNNYQHTNQSYEQNQWSEPQSEVLTVSNVKPSTITKNQQWYQQTNRENTTSSLASTAPILPSQQLGQSYIQPQPQIQVQQPEQQYHSYMQPQYTPKPEFKSYVETNTLKNYRSASDLQPNTYSNYTPKPSWTSSIYESKPVNQAPPIQTNHYSSSKESTENFQHSAQFSSSYVPPPWEQDSSYVTENQNYYQPAPSTTPFTPSTNQTWKPKPASKFSKNTSTSYIPPAPNQSFVKPVTANDHSKLPGRKTYYSEYERRYISVPESTYIPSETKFQAQPDPSPQYYYDNNEPAEIVEPQWRKELREFTEKTSEISTQYEKASVRPPWEEDPKYAAQTEYTATVTPSWTQTLRPRTWRERSYEPEYIGSKTNTLGRGRPQSSYVKGNVDTIQERPRGVSVDRYNPNNYQTPLASEHPPVQSHTLNPNIHQKTYHNPHVPAYHSRASAEPREQVSYPQPRPRVESRAPPVQSRSFKYLQWITGTED